MSKTKKHHDLLSLSACALAGRLAEGSLRAVELTEACLARIEEKEEEVQAWIHLDPDYALRQARALDRQRQSGRAIGPLHGLPIAVKDVIDVQGLPCENGTVLDAGRRPSRDAFVITRLREAGAVILGKTVTTELAVYEPGKTRNPHDPARTPGGSSSGSAAAVASAMAPLALGTQTNGSIIRPASYCGVVGFKPSRGLISRYRVLTQSPTLDHMGGFARTIEDVALLHDGMAGYDERDPAMRLAARPALLEAARSEPPLRPVLGFVRSPLWEEIDPDIREGFEELRSELGDVEEVALPAAYDRGVELQRLIHVADLAKHYSHYYKKGRDQISPTVREMIEEGQRVLALDYNVAHDLLEVLNAGLDEIFERFDALITPGTTGQAPGIEATGSPALCSLWTLCGVPTMSLPLLVGHEGLPIGVQLVGKRGLDGRLLRTARWLVENLRERAENGAVTA